ncbi:hypothetical protein HG530_003684 [Fusarium avenaceum]|nr:hypothetical protein HG530_003684 [Fusarium avenaceum]
MGLASRKRCQTINLPGSKKALVTLVGLWAQHPSSELPIGVFQWLLDDGVNHRKASCHVLSLGQSLPFSQRDVALNVLVGNAGLVIEIGAFAAAIGNQANSQERRQRHSATVVGLNNPLSWVNVSGEADDQGERASTRVVPGDTLIRRDGAIVNLVNKATILATDKALEVKPARNDNLKGTTNCTDMWPIAIHGVPNRLPWTFVKDHRVLHPVQGA